MVKWDQTNYLIMTSQYIGGKLNEPHKSKHMCYYSFIHKAGVNNSDTNFLCVFIHLFIYFLNSIFFSNSLCLESSFNNWDHTHQQWLSEKFIGWPRYSLGMWPNEVYFSTWSTHLFDWCLDPKNVKSQKIINNRYDVIIKISQPTLIKWYR